MRLTMKKSLMWGLVLGMILSGCTVKPKDEPDPDKITETVYTVTLKRDVLVMMLAYPDLVTGVQLIDKKPYLSLASGKTLIYDDGLTKTYDEKVNNADIQDMLEQPYPLSDATGIASENNDPGRFRVYAFFDDLYGSTKEVTYGNLIKVTYGSQSLKFTKINNAATALQAASDEAAALVAQDQSVAAYLYPSSGTYNYRVISGTSILSMHAYGIALDMKYNSQDYWQWADPIKAEARIVNYPKTLVKIFESHGFIWGGKWNHFDTVHYEYRPEIILKATYFSDPIDLTKAWTTGIDITDPKVKAAADQIDARLKALYETD